MAEIAPDSALAEVIGSLDLATVPEKLHCSTCHNFLLNAYKTSCCEQNICEQCFNTVADLCPMCKHKPFSRDLCRPAKAMRNTVKAYLKSVEKNLSDERAKTQVDLTSPANEDEAKSMAVADAQAEANEEIENGTIEIPTQLEEPTQDSITPVADIQPSIENDEEHSKRQGSEDTDVNDDEVEIQVEPSAEDNLLDMSQQYEVEEPEQMYEGQMHDETKGNGSAPPEMSNGVDSNGYMQNMGLMNFGNMGMDNMNMMQQMMNMNQMMSMGMNSMFGGFGGPNGNMNGMNMMGMNFNPNQMFNMWQNNNAMNAMGGDFGSQYGSNMSQQGNFQHQQFPNGDFSGHSNRFGRGGRFRGRGGYGRGRGSFNQYQQPSGYQNAHEQQQYEIQSMQAQMTQNTNDDNEPMGGSTNHREEEGHDQEDFAPGGQDEVQEALGDIDQRSKDTTSDVDSKTLDTDGNTPMSSKQEQHTADDSAAHAEKPVQEKIIPEAYSEDFESMAPPSAPTGPSRRYSDKDFAFRARGHGKYLSRNSGSFSTPTGYPPSPIRTASQSSIAAPSPPNKGLGVVGAPTGPRAMRDPSTTKPPPRPAVNTGGFQIIGRASMQPQGSTPREEDSRRSASPTNGYDDIEDDRTTSRRHSRHDRHDEHKGEGEIESNHDHDRDDRDRDRDRDRRSRRSKRDDYKDDYEMQDMDQDYDSQERKSSHRSNRHEKERSRKEDKHSTSTRHRSSRRHYDDEVQSDYERDDYGEPVADSKHRSSRSGKSSSKHENERDRDKDSHRDRKRDRDRDRDRDHDRDRHRDREDERAKEKSDKHRKRSRHDRDREDGYEDPDEEESRHRSRRHKEYRSSSSRKDRDREVEDTDLGLRISGRSSSNRQTALPTPTSATSSIPPSSAGPEKDPHTLEREARNHERMLKEQQRREKAALDKRGTTSGTKSSRAITSGGRRVSYKYEDEVERGMGGADEREKARWR